MSKQAPAQNSSFSIRFRPAAATDQRDELGIADDVCDIEDGSPSRNGSCEAVLFERLSNAEDQAHSSEFADGRPDSHPSSLWNNSQAILSHSAPVSEVASPMSPAGGALPFVYEKIAAINPLAGSQPLAEKLSIFSGLKEKLDKLSTESKEIFDRKMKRSGSADSAKIASLLAEPSMSRSEPVKTEAGGENGGFVAKTDSVRQPDEQKPEVIEESIEGDSTASACSSNCVHKSTSSIEVTKADVVSMSVTKQKRASLGNECVQQPVVMSHLLSSTSQSDNRQYFHASSNTSRPSELSQNVNEDGRHATGARRVRKRKRFISAARFRCLFSLLVAAVAYVIIPIPPYVAGMLVGAFLSAITILFYQRLTRSRHSAPVSASRNWSSASVTADVRESKNVDGKFQVCKILDSLWSTVCKTVRPMLSDRCLSVLSWPVYDFGVLWPNS